ncbi:hypothetical protein CR513_19564, partial [Mucuna pruriens]
MIDLGINKKEIPWILSKGKIPHCLGNDSLNDYYDLEMKVEKFFECIDCDDMIKIAIKIRGMRRAPINSWDELKREMRERFVPSFYTRDHFVKLERMYQGSKGMEEYFKEMEVTLIRAQVVESQEASMARFVHGLNRDIQDIIELHKYTSLFTLGRDILPHNSLNKRTMILRENEDVESESSQEQTSILGNEGGYSSEEALYKGDLLMVRRLMETFVRENQSQRENIFHVKCRMRGCLSALDVESIEFFLRANSRNVSAQKEPSCPYSSLPSRANFKAQVTPTRACVAHSH